jgi:hypothetical protein
MENKLFASYINKELQRELSVVENGEGDLVTDSMTGTFLDGNIRGNTICLINSSLKNDIEERGESVIDKVDYILSFAHYERV